MTLEALTPDPDWDPDDHADALSVMAAQADGLTVRIWCGDWCGDCHELLPPFAAALEAIDFPADSLVVHPVEKRSDGSKVGEAVDAFDVDRTPTVVISIGEDEVARFEEGRTAPPILEALAAQLERLEAGLDQP